MKSLPYGNVMIHEDALNAMYNALKLVVSEAENGNAEIRKETVEIVKEAMRQYEED